MPVKDYKMWKAEKLDGGLVTRVPAHMLQSHQSPDAQNFDPSEVGANKKRKGYIKFTSAAKSSPTGTFVNGLFAGTPSKTIFDKALQFDDSAGTYVDLTSAMSDFTGGNVSPFPAAEAANDIFYVGSSVQFAGLEVVIATPGVGGTVAWEYYNGSTWASLSNITDGTSGFTAAAGTANARWPVPTDWATVAVNSSTQYWVRARLTGTYSTNPVLDNGWASVGKDYVWAAEGTALHDISAGAWGSALTGTTFSSDTMTRMWMFNDLLIVLNRGGGPWKHRPGTTSVTALSGSPPGNARGGGVHRNRNWMYGDSSTLSFSALSDVEDWTSTDNAGSVTVNKGDGYVINGFISGGDFAIISKISISSSGKEGALYGLFGSSPFDFYIKKIASTGALSQEAMLSYDNMVFVATNRGIYGINGRNWARIDDPIFPTYEAITTKTSISMGRDGKRIKVAYIGTGSTNNREFIYDVERGVWGLNTGKTNRIYANHPDGRLLMGTSGTSILVWEDENGANDDGSNISWYWNTPEIVLGNPAITRTLRETHLQMSNNITTTISLDQIVDGSSQSWGETISTATGYPVKRFTNKAKNGKLHQIKLSDNSANGQTKVLGIAAYLEDFEPGVP